MVVITTSTTTTIIVVVVIITLSSFAHFSIVFVQYFQKCKDKDDFKKEWKITIKLKNHHSYHTQKI